MDTVNFVNSKQWGVEDPAHRNWQERSAHVQDLMEQYKIAVAHSEDTAFLKESVLREVYFLFPNILQRQSIPKELFDESMQNMVLETFRAMDRFDLSFGVPFAVYLRKYLKAAIAEAKQESKVIKTPATVRQNTLNRLSAQAEEAKDTETALKAYSRYAELTPSYVHTDEAHETNADAFYEKCATEFNERQSVDNKMMSAELIDVLEYVLDEKSNVLSTRERLTIMHRYGIFNVEKMTLDEVARRFERYGWKGSAEWVFQLEKRALKKIHRVYKFLDLS